MEEFVNVFYRPKRIQTPSDDAWMNACVDPAVTRCTALEEEMREEFRKTLVAYRDLHAFLSQTIPLQDSDLEKLYSCARFLLKEIPPGEPCNGCR